jgi:hypothetical protein
LEHLVEIFQEKKLFLRKNWKESSFGYIPLCNTVGNYDSNRGVSINDVKGVIIPRFEGEFVEKNVEKNVIKIGQGISLILLEEYQSDCITLDGSVYLVDRLLSPVNNMSKILTERVKKKFDKFENKK